jgi:hypothetical protein
MKRFIYILTLLLALALPGERPFQPGIAGSTPLTCSAPTITAPTSEPEIVGSARFIRQVYQAMLLLKTHDPGAYTIVTSYVGRIEEAPRSGMWAYSTPPTYAMSDRTAFYSITWCAATIAHDSFHSKLYHEYQTAHQGRVPDAVWTGVAAEQQCMKHQLTVMERIGATKREINWARTQADGHYAKDGATWEDWWKLDW